MRVKALLPYKATIQGSITTVIPSLLVVVFMTLFSACQSEETTGDSVHQTSLAFHVSTNRVVTRMSDAVTQQKGKAYRGIMMDELWLFPFDATPFDATETTSLISLSGNVIKVPADMKQNTENKQNYYHDNFPEIPVNTSRFLCYARAVPETGNSVNGSLTPSITDATTAVTPSAITFTPVTLVEADETIAFAYIDSDPTDEMKDEINKNNKNRFIYPPELYYFANSTIKTSYSHQKSYYNLDWSDVLSRYENDDATYLGDESSVAIKDPLHYAVGCLQIGLVANATLRDAEGKAFTLSSGTFPLTGVFVTGQYEQNYDFTPKYDDETKEFIIYDKDITGVSMGSSLAATPTVFSNTLVLQTNDGKGIRFALEFQNNTTEFFIGSNGKVDVGDKFYLVGTIQVTTGHAGAEAYKNRVFTKDYITQGIVKIESLKQAYTYLPDLMDPRLEVTLKLEPDWIQSTTTNVPL